MDLPREVGEKEVQTMLRELVPPLEEDAPEEDGYDIPSPGTLTSACLDPPLPTRTKKLSLASSFATTMRSSATQSSIYHTPSSSLHLSSFLSSSHLSSPSPHLSSSSNLDPRSDFDESDGETITDSHEHNEFENHLGPDPSEEARERARGVDIWMSSSPPRAPATLGRSKGVSGISELAREGDGVVGSGLGVEREETGVKGFCTSAKTGEGVEEVFEYLVRRVLRRWKREATSAREEGGEVVRLGNGEGVQEKKGWRASCCS